MRKLVMKLLLAAFLLGGAIFAFSSFKYPQVTNIKISRIDSFADNKYYGSGSVKILNSTYLKLSAKNVKFDLYYKDRIISSGQSQQDFLLKSKNETDVPVRFVVLIDSLIEFANEILNQDSVELTSEVRGNFTALNFKLEHKEKIKISAKEITNGIISATAKNSFKLKDPIIKNIKFEKTELGITLVLKNNFPFELIIDKANFDVFLKSNSSAKVSDWELPNRLMLPSGSDTSISSMISINNMRAGSGLFEKMLSRRLDFYISGFVAVNYDGNILNIPVKQHLGLNPFSGEVEVIEDTQ